jgi:Helix-turn-helix domain/RodZ C-terminal domain
MFEIGASLREARNRRGLTPADVQKSLRIRERYLTALEEEHWEQLPGDAYVKGFMRTYAEFLGLNGQLYIEEYNSRFTVREEAPLVPDSLAPRTRRRGLLRMVGLTAVVVGTVAGLAAWQLGGGTHTVAQAPAIGAEDAAAAPKPAVEPTPAATPKPRAIFAVVRAPRGRSWITVRVGDENGKVLYEGILEQGKTLRFGLGQKLWMRMGRPWLLDVRLGGHVVRGFPYEPSNVLLTRDGAVAA